MLCETMYYTEKKNSVDWRTGDSFSHCNKVRWPTSKKTVAVNRGYDTYFGNGIVMGYAGYKCLKGLVETSK